MHPVGKHAKDLTGEQYEKAKIIENWTMAASVFTVFNIGVSPVSAQTANATHCSKSNFGAMNALITFGIRNKYDAAVITRARNYVASAKKAMAANNKAACGKNLITGMTMLRNAHADAMKKRYSSSRFCTTRYVNLLNSQIQTGVKQKYNPKALANAKTRHSSAKKALARKDLSTCGTDIKNGMRIMSVERLKVMKNVNAKFCSKANLGKLDTAIQKGKTLKVNARTLAAAKKRYDSAKKTMAARRLADCGAQIKNGLSVMAKAMKSK